ncbi:MAG: hypothetical protein R6V57_14010 [Vicinamibacterales bacterium]
MRRLILGIATVLLLLPAAARGQALDASAAAPAAVPTSLSPRGRLDQGTLKVFLDCKDRTPCYSDYVRTEVAYVDYVNVREAAHVHVLITSLGSGAGGREITMKFVGLGDFAGIDDEVLYLTLPTDTEELARRAFVRTLKLGLVRYALRTGLSSQLNVTHKPADGGQKAPSASRSVQDPWNHWVFRARANTSGEIESASETRQYNGSLSASRVTDAWKFGVSTYQDYRENVYTYSDGGSYTSLRRSYDVTAQAVKSLTGHWSAGVKTYVAGSTYENKDRVLNASAAIEWNLFPYSESTRRQLTFQYILGVTNYDYIEETVYEKTEQTAASHMFRTSFDLRQTWGSLSADLDFFQYFYDTSVNRRSLQVEGDVRLFKGFALNFSGRTAGIHDQIYLPKGEATDEEVLARQRQLATSFRHSFRIGISYTFGSIFSNVVNTRLSNFVGG